MADPLTPELRDTLANLAAGYFGLDAWIKAPGKYIPPGPLPWRAAGHTFVPADMGVIPFFEDLLRQSGEDDDLGDRWTALSADPLKFNPLPFPHTWREHRGLSPAPKFAIAKSSNVWLVDAGGTVISRTTFYTSCWPLLISVVAAKNKQGPVDWAALAKELLTDANPIWPKTQQPPSSAFITQFASDMLYAMLGMRNPVPAPWKFAVLIELGEHRRVGNEYKSEQVGAAVAQFEKLL